MDIVPGQPIRGGQHQAIQFAITHAIAQLIQAGSLERGTAIAVVAKDVFVWQWPALRLHIGPQAFQLLFNGLCLHLIGRSTPAHRSLLA